MKLFDKPLLLIILFASTFFIINESFTYYIGLEKAKNEYFKKDKLIFENLVSSQNTSLQTLAILLASDRDIIKGYEENDPQLIREHVTPLWNQVKKEKLTYEIHFFKPPAISFVNFSNFKSIGKDVSDVRTDIEWITSSFKASSHALMCKTYAGYRVTQPIVDNNGTMLGGLSLGKKIDWFPEAIKEKTKHDAFLVYTKASTHSLGKKYYDNFINNKEIVNGYILANKTIKVSTEKVLEIDFTKEIQNITINQKNYTLFTYPIIDFNKEIMGYICTLTQLEEFTERFTAQFLKNFIIILLTVLLIFFITRKKITDLLKQIKYIKNITIEVKRRNFEILHKLKNHTSANETPLIKLENNIIEMGLELEKKYHHLEDENREKTHQLISQLYTDTLTSLANRNALVKDLKNNNHAYLAIFNIRNFKEINDAFGFETGNYILKELANKFAPFVNKQGCQGYRVGSDEFVLMNQEGIFTQESFKELVLDILSRIDSTLFRLHDEEIEIGITMYAGICFETTKRLEKANMALSQAKKYKKEHVVYSSKEDKKASHLKNIETINQVSKALQNDDILVYYQPIVDCNGLAHKYEALVRMRNKDEIISPYFFLEISKRTKYYSDITKVVIQKTFDKFGTLDTAFSINITAEDILNEEIVGIIQKKLHLCKIPEKVVFELVESDDLYHLPEIIEFINYVKSMGAKIAIDDFGTGYSNFSYMLKIKPDYLKIDGSLIKNIDTDSNAHKIVTTIVSFSNEIGIKTIAEFVHSKEVFEVCKSLGIDEFQGYYFGEPKSELP